METQQQGPTRDQVILTVAQILRAVIKGVVEDYGFDGFDIYEDAAEIALKLEKARCSEQGHVGNAARGWTYHSGLLASSESRESNDVA